MANLQSVLKYLISTIDSLIKLLIGVALVGFLLGVFKYLAKGNDPNKLKESKNFMIYGLFSMFVIVSFWALIILIGSVFGISLGTNNGNYLESISSESDSEINLDATLQEDSGIFGNNYNSDNSDVDSANLYEAGSPDAEVFWDTVESNESSLNTDGDQ